MEMMKKVFLAVAAVFMLVAVVLFALSLVPEQPEISVSEMDDQQLLGFIQQYKLYKFEEAADLWQLRMYASTFEKTGVIDLRMNEPSGMFSSFMIMPYMIELTNALADYYDRPECAIYTNFLGEMPAMKVTYLYLTILFLSLAIIFLLPCVFTKQQRVQVSRMNDKQLRRFLRKSGLEDREEARDLSVIRQCAQSFERTHMVLMLTMSEDFVQALEKALATYYGVER